MTRRKSCSDAVIASQEEKERAARVQRHSLGSNKEGTASTPKSKGLSSRRNGSEPNGTLKVRDRFKQENGATKTAPPKIADQTNVDIAVQSWSCSFSSDSTEGIQKKALNLLSYYLLGVLKRK